MTTLEALQPVIQAKRKQLALTQKDLAEMAHVSLPTIKALEQGRTGELGFSKVARILAALGLDLSLSEANHGRPTLDELQHESKDD